MKFIGKVNPKNMIKNHGTVTAESIDIDLSLAHTHIVDANKYNGKNITKINIASSPPNISYGVTFSSNGLWMAVSHSNAPYITVYNTNDWSKRTDITTSNDPPSTGKGIAFSHDSNWLAISHDTSPYITVYETDTWTKETIAGTTGNGHHVKFNHDDSLMAVAHSTTPYITVYNTNDWSKRTDISSGNGNLPGSTAYGVDFSSNGLWMAVGFGSGNYINVYDIVNSWNLINGPSVTGIVYDVQFNYDGLLLAIAHATSPFLSILKTSTWEERSIPTIIPSSTAYGVGFSPDGTLVSVLNSSSPYIITYDTLKLTTYQTPTNPPTSTTSDQKVAYSPDASLMAVTHSNSPYVTVYEKLPNPVLLKNPINIFSTGGYKIKIIANNGQIFTDTNYKTVDGININNHIQKYFKGNFNTNQVILECIVLDGEFYVINIDISI